MSDLFGFLMVLYMFVAILVFGFSAIAAFTSIDSSERRRASRRAILAFIWPVMFVSMIRDMWKWSELGSHSDPLKFPKERADEIDRIRRDAPRRKVLR